MTEVDTTLQALLAVHRHEVADLEQSVAFLESQRDDLNRRIEVCRRDVDRADEQARRTREARDALATKVDKLEGVVESLKIELQNERAAHTEAREAHTSPEDSDV
jgi:chromosome segregation ATPase